MSPRRALSRSSPICVSFTDTLASSLCWRCGRASRGTPAPPRAPRLALHALAEQIERCSDLGVEARTASSAGVERLAGDEARCEALREAVAPHQVEHPRLVREIEKCLSKHLLVNHAERQLSLEYWISSARAKLTIEVVPGDQSVIALGLQ